MDMKIIDRVIMCMTNNEKYLDFWNYISKVYRTKFDTLPTLMFSGSEQEYRTLIESERLSPQYGEIIHLPRVNGVHFDSNLDWTCTWGLFYGASLFPDDVCMLSGIDQIPLSGLFYDAMREHFNRSTDYIIGFSDAYSSNPNRLYPSSHHVALGKSFKTLYGIDDSWSVELQKVYSNRNNYPVLPNSLWGLDEFYSSDLINQHIASQKTNIHVLLVENFAGFWRSRRFDRAFGKIPVNAETLNGIKNSAYSEYHAVRPFSANHQMDDVYHAIPFVSNTISSPVTIPQP